VFIPYQPFWSIIVIAVCVMVIWALTTQTEDVIDEGSTADSGM